MSKKKKILLIIFILILLITLGTIVIVKYVSKNNPSNNLTDLSNNSNNNSNIQDEKIYLFGKELKSLDDLEENDIQEYLKIVAMTFKEKTYTVFSDEQISVVVAIELLIEGSSSSTDEVALFVKKLFGKEGFELKAGKYISPLNEEIIISKNGDKFTSNLLAKGTPPPYNFYNSMEIKNNQVIVHYDYGNMSLATGEMTLIGNMNIYLNHTEGNLIIEKIVYTKK